MHISQNEVSYYPSRHVVTIFILWKELKIYSASNFRVCNIVNYSRHAVRYTPRTILLATGRCTFDLLCVFLPSPTPGNQNTFSVSRSLAF